MADTFTLPDLPYDYDALEPHYDAATLELHHSKHHKGYVDGVNSALTAWPARVEAETSLPSSISNASSPSTATDTSCTRSSGG